MVNPYLIGQPLPLRREAILSSRIEGTFTTPEQLVLLEAGVPAAGQDARASADTREVARSSGLLGTLIDDLFRLPSITIGRTTELLSVTPAAASSNLRKLQALGIVAEVTGRARGQVFVARDILNFVGRDPAATPSPGPA